MKPDLPLPSQHSAILRVVGPIESQNPDWPCGFFDFGKLNQPGIDYFNCGLVERPDGTWLVTRRSKAHPKIQLGMNDIMCFLLEDKMPVKGIKANIHAPFPGLEHFEDPRAVYHNGTTYLCCCNFIIKNNGWTGAHQIVAAMNDEWNCLKRYDPNYGKNGDSLGSNTGIEKNWLWFFYNNDPHLVYLTNPHTIVRCNREFVPQTEFVTQSDLPWQHGEPRGGTPPVLVNGEYWSFFHSSTNWRTQAPTRQYHMGAYAFESRPPFRITRMTNHPILSGSAYNRWVQTKPLVVFPNGALLKDGVWFVTGGSNDIESFWIDIPHKELKTLTVTV